LRTGFTGDRGAPLASFWTKFKGVSPKNIGIRTRAVTRKIVLCRRFIEETFPLSRKTCATGRVSFSALLNHPTQSTTLTAVRPAAPLLTGSARGRVRRLDKICRNGPVKTTMVSTQSRPHGIPITTCLRPSCHGPSGLRPSCRASYRHPYLPGPSPSGQSSGAAPGS